MGANDAAEMLEVAKEECGRLERELAELSRAFEDAVKVANSAQQKVAEQQAAIERVRADLAPIVASDTPDERSGLVYAGWVLESLSTSGTEALETRDAEKWDEGYEAAATFHEGREKGHWENDSPRKGIRTWVPDPAPANPYRKTGEQSNG